MIENNERYDLFIREIMRKMHILKTRQLIIAIKNNFDIEKEDFALKILYEMQNKGYLLLSEDGYAMTQGYYLNITRDFFFDGIVKNNSLRVPKKIYLYGINEEGKTGPLKELKLEEQITKKDKQNIACMWLVIDMLPDSFEFVIGDRPWNVIFTTEATETKKGLLYEVTYIPQDSEDINIEIIKNIPKVDAKELRESIRRIAILEDERHEWKVPHLGFTHICKIDEEKSNGYRLINKPRKLSEAWKDYVA